METLDEALDHARGGPQGDESGDDQERDGAGAGDAELLDHQIFRAGRDDFRKPVLEGGGNEVGMGLHQDGGGRGEHRKEREQGRIGGAFRHARGSRHRTPR